LKGKTEKLGEKPVPVPLCPFSKVTPIYSIPSYNAVFIFDKYPTPLNHGKTSTWEYALW
jgi:hypothetical protein